VNVRNAIAEYAIQPRHVYHHAFNGFAASLTPALLEGLLLDSRVVTVESDSPVTLMSQVIPEGVARIAADVFPVAHINGSHEALDVDVAVLDTGIDLTHPDLRAYTNYSVWEGYGEDTFGHGTGVSGVLCAWDNDIGAVGVAPGIRLWNVQVYGAAPFNTWSTVLLGMEYVAQNADRISVVNVSIGSQVTAPLGSIRSAVQAMVNRGVVVVAGAGNDARDLAGLDGVFGTNDDRLPAALPEVMAVSGIEHWSDRFYTNSNYNGVSRTNHHVISPGGAIDVAAPSVNIFTTTTNGGYRLVAGTSFAGPHVAGLVALYIAANGRATNAEGVYRIRQAIVDASLPQSQWRTNSTGDPDGNPEPLALANESWVPTPRITRIPNNPGRFELSFTAVPGYDYSAQFTDDLSHPPGWTDIATASPVQAPTNRTIVDPNPHNLRRFYRLVRRPSP
jgi:subtilisin family serine protease